MTIRLSTSQVHQRGVNSLLEITAQVAKTQEQISTGRRVLTPADDPIASTRILQLRKELALNEQYHSNLDTLQNRLEREEVALAGVTEFMQRAHELIVQAGNGGINATQRGFIAVELKEIIEGIAQIMNSRDASGEYIFAGFQGKDAPFVKDADGRYIYRGDEGQRSIKINSATTVNSNDSGKEVFMNIDSSVTTVKTRSGDNNTANPPASITSGKIVDRELFDEFYPEDAIIEFRPTDEVDPPAVTYNIKKASDGTVIARNQSFSPGAKIEFEGIAVRITGNPLPGDSFIVESSAKKGLLENLEDFVANMENLGDGKEQLALVSDEINHTLSNLDNAQTNLLEVRSSIGARLNMVDATRASNEDFNLVVEKTLSELSDLDFAEAISRLSQETFILEASQASFSKISQLSLFNFI